MTRSVFLTRSPREIPLKSPFCKGGDKIRPKAGDKITVGERAE